jgi:hypothetical protein
MKDVNDVDMAAKSKSVKGIGHEARKPLVSLINTADLLLAGLEGELSEQVRRDIEAMKRHAQDALKAVDALIARLNGR